MKYNEEWRQAHIREKSIPGRENNMCKGPEVRFCLEGLKKSKDAGRRGRKSEGESGRS